MRKDPRQVPMGFLLPHSEWQAPERLPLLSGATTVAIDIETKDDGLANDRGPGWVYNAGYISGIALAWEGGSVYLPLRHPDTEIHISEAEVFNFIAELHQSDTEVIYHRSAYDLGWLCHWAELPWPRNLHDTMLSEFMLEEYHFEYGLDAVCRRRGVPGKDEEALRAAAEAYGCDPKKDMWRLPARYVGPYAEQDARATLSLWNLHKPQLKTQQVWDAYILETQVVEMALAMRKRGVRVNSSNAQRAMSQLLGRRDEFLAEMSRRLCIGREVTMSDINSPRFLGSILRNENIPIPQTAKGNDSFQTDYLDKIDHWLCDLIVGARKMHDAGDKFLGNYILGFTHMGRIHAEIHTTKSDDGGTRTTRLAYSEPPLQQMPSRVPEIKKAIRGAFEPEEGEIWGAQDYSQQEYRLIVHFAYLCKIAGAELAVKMYRDDPNTDFHNLAAELTQLPRRRAKDVNFAKAFGAGKAKFALMTGMGIDEAADTMDQYDEKLPFVKGLYDYASRLANSRGYVRLIDGARSRYERWEPRWWDRGYVGPALVGPCDLEEAHRRLNDPEHPWEGKLKRAMTHKAMNSLIQGSAARQTKKAMVTMFREGVVPLIQMHDELDHSFGREDRELAEWCAETMRNVIKLEVPVAVDAEYGVNWGDAAASGDYDATWDSAWRKKDAMAST